MSTALSTAPVPFLPAPSAHFEGTCAPMFDLASVADQILLDPELVEVLQVPRGATDLVLDDNAPT